MIMQAVPPKTKPVSHLYSRPLLPINRGPEYFFADGVDGGMDVLAPH